MKWLRDHRVSSAWVGIFAILLMALAPAISHAWQGKATSSWIEVCTALGAKWINAAADQEDPGPPPAPIPSHQVMEHCPYCALHVSDLGLPPGTLAAPALLAPSSDLPELFLASPRPLFAWAAAQARAPPRRS